MSSRTDRSSSGYSAGRTSQSLSREELLNQTIGMFARLVCLLLGIGSHISTSLPHKLFRYQRVTRATPSITSPSRSGAQS